MQSFRGTAESFTLPTPLAQQLKALGRQEQATLFMTLEASFAALLYRYTGQEDLLVGTPISGRTLSETENLIGCIRTWWFCGRGWTKAPASVPCCGRRGSVRWSLRALRVALWPAGG